MSPFLSLSLSLSPCLHLALPLAASRAVAVRFIFLIHHRIYSCNKSQRFITDISLFVARFITAFNGLSNYYRSLWHRHRRALPIYGPRRKLAARPKSPFQVLPPLHKAPAQIRFNFLPNSCTIKTYPWTITILRIVIPGITNRILYLTRRKLY